MPFTCPKCAGHTFSVSKDGLRGCTGKVYDVQYVPLVKDPTAAKRSDRPMTLKERRDAVRNEAVGMIPGSPQAYAAIAASQSAVITQSHERTCTFWWDQPDDGTYGVTEEDLAALAK
jgi:hypothetical protein